MFCPLIFIHEQCDLQLTSTPNDRFLRNFFNRGLLLSEFLPAICWEEIAKQNFFFHFSFWGSRTVVYNSGFNRTCIISIYSSLCKAAFPFVLSSQTMILRGSLDFSAILLHIIITSYPFSFSSFHDSFRNIIISPSCWTIFFAHSLYSFDHLKVN